MRKYISHMNSVSPVYTANEVQFEKNIAEHQPEYIPVIGLPVTLNLVDSATGETKQIENWGISVRFRFTEEERAMIAAGDDLVITQIVFGKPITPINIQLVPDGIAPTFDLDNPDVSRIL